MGKDSTKEPRPQIIEEPPTEPDWGYVRNSLVSINKALGKQVAIEIERTGASKLRNRILTAFGSIITAAALAGFGWVGKVQGSINEQETTLKTLEREFHVHDPDPPGHEDIESDIEALDTEIEVERARVSMVEQTQTNIGEQLKKQGEDIRDILREIRSIRRSTR